MNPVLNPFAPGAGTAPPELAGRDDLIERAAVAPKRIRMGRSARSIILHGLRGVGKTVLLNRIIKEAESSGIFCARMEAPEGRSLPALLSPAHGDTAFTVPLFDGIMKRTMPEHPGVRQAN